jgi:hypothetical protein
MEVAIHYALQAASSRERGERQEEEPLNGVGGRRLRISRRSRVASNAPSSGDGRPSAFVCPSAQSPQITRIVGTSSSTTNGMGRPMVGRAAFVDLAPVRQEVLAPAHHDHVCSHPSSAR